MANTQKAKAQKAKAQLKITINKRAFTMDQARDVHARLEEIRECVDAEEIRRAAEFYAHDTIEGIYDVQAEITGNVHHLMPGGEIDCWIDMLIECFSKCVRVGFYVGDFWMLDDHNREEVMKRAYIREFREVKRKIDF